MLYESLIALQKIRDESAGPKMAFLLRDLNSRVQIAAIETTGLLKNREAVPDLLDVLKRSKDAKVRRAALGSLAMMPDRENARRLPAVSVRQGRQVARRRRRRLRAPAQSRRPRRCWNRLGRTKARARRELSLAFALVMLGRTEISEFSPLQFLINNLNSSAYKGEAVPFLSELARDPAVRQALYAAHGYGNQGRENRLGASTRHQWRQRECRVSGEAEPRPGSRKWRKRDCVR